MNRDFYHLISVESGRYGISHISSHVCAKLTHNRPSKAWSPLFSLTDKDCGVCNGVNSSLTTHDSADSSIQPSGAMPSNQVTSFQWLCFYLTGMAKRACVRGKIAERPLKLLSLSLVGRFGESTSSII